MRLYNKSPWRGLISTKGEAGEERKNFFKKKGDKEKNLEIEIGNSCGGIWRDRLEEQQRRRPSLVRAAKDFQELTVAVIDDVRIDAAAAVDMMAKQRGGHKI